MNGVRASPVTEACFTRTVQTRDMLIPAQSQEHVRWNDVLLQLRPFLPGLRRSFGFLVRSVHRYYGTVRLLQHVHVRRSVYGLRGPAFTYSRRRVWRSPGSRACCFLACAGSQTTQDRTATRDNAAAVLPSSYSEGSRHPDLPAFRSSITPPTKASGLRFETHLAVGSARLQVRMESLSPFL